MPPTTSSHLPATRLIVAILAGLVMVATACSDAGSVAVDPVEDDSQATTTAPVPEPSGDEALEVDDEGGGSDDDQTGETIDPLLIGISVHVEGWGQEATNRDMFEIHRDGLLDLATEVSEGGGILTFELSSVFMEAVDVWEDDVLDRLQAMGHSIAIHADIGGRGDTSLPGMTTALTDKREALADLGVVTDHVSGICSRGPWVEAALASGFTSASGGVAYCATSMDPSLVAAADQWVFDCEGPSDCHGEPPVTEDRRYRPFYADSSADWMVSDSTGGLLIISSESGHSLPCLDRSAPGEDQKCIATDADLKIALVTLDEYVAAREPGETTALAYSWSIGNMPEDGFGTDLVEALAEAVNSGDAVWVGVDQIGAIVDGTIDIAPETEAEPAALPDGESGEPLATVISIHTHLDRDWQPYTNPTMTELDAELLASTIDLLTTTADLLDSYGVVANFQMSYGIATALCSTDDGGSLVSSLQESGHEIGLHTHGDEFAARTYSALVDECGVTPSTASGIQFSIAMAPTPLAGAEGWLVEMESLGLTTVLAGLGVSDSPLSFVCETYDEESRDDDANALLHSWLSDPQDPCTSDPAGELAIITHSDRDTRAMATINTGLDNVDADDFATWSAQLDAAIGAADPLSTWGVVMALPAMMTDASADPTYLVELDSFLTDLSDHIDAGTVVSVTAAEAAASLR